MKKFKPYLRMLLDRDVIMLSVIGDEYLKNMLNSDSYAIKIKNSNCIEKTTFDFSDRLVLEETTKLRDQYK